MRNQCSDHLRVIVSNLVGICTTCDENMTRCYRRIAKAENREIQRLEKKVNKLKQMIKWQPGSGAMKETQKHFEDLVKSAVK